MREIVDGGLGRAVKVDFKNSLKVEFSQIMLQLLTCLASLPEDGIVRMPPILGMARSAQQECFGDAFLLAVAANAGCGISPRRPDDDSIDWTISCRLPRRPKLDVQMKTWIGDTGEGDTVQYPLKRKNYDDLTLPVLIPRILVLISLPEAAGDWLSASSEQLIIRKCAFWLSLVGLPATENETSVTLSIPRENLLTVDALVAIMLRINDGGVP